MTDDMKEMLYKVGGMGDPKGRYPRIEEDDDTQVYKKPWVGLTEWEREAIAVECGAMSADWLVFMEAVEKALKEKNT